MSTNKLEHRDHAADLVRNRIEALYGHYQQQNDHNGWAGKAAEFWQKHHTHPNPHQAWRDYYQSLSEEERHALWEDYHIQAGKLSAIGEHSTEVKDLQEEALKGIRPAVAKKMRKLMSGKRSGPFVSFFKEHVMPIVLAAIFSGGVWLVFNNELVVASVRQYVTPGSSSLSPTIIDPMAEVSDHPRIIIPKINVTVPLVLGITSFDEAEIQRGLERGVVHYGNTALPGQASNSVFVGHSSNNFFNSGEYKFAFVLLNKLDIGDIFIIDYEGTRYVYRVNIKRIIVPTDFSLVQPSLMPIATLITCDPPGTARNRLVVQGEQISPNPLDARPPSTADINPDDSLIIPGNAESLWSKFWQWIF